MKNPYAVFVIVKDRFNNRIACTTRANDKNRYSLIGGKVEPDDKTPLQALKREISEEGWSVDNILPFPTYTNENNGNVIWFYIGFGAKKRTVYKEKGRISPVWLSEKIIMKEYKNSFIKEI